jgi:predicted GIY-YIG superfamily endonuclease
MQKSIDKAIEDSRNGEQQTYDNYSIYLIYDITSGDVMYVGRTKQNPKDRFKQHQNDITKQSWIGNCEIATILTGLDYQEARVREQSYISFYTLDHLHNAIRGIAEKKIDKFMDHIKAIVSIEEGWIENEFLDLMHK